MKHPDNDPVVNKIGFGSNSSQLQYNNPIMPAPLLSWSRFKRGIASLARMSCENEPFLGNPFS